jgi:hypothetical protein
MSTATIPDVRTSIHTENIVLPMGAVGVRALTEAQIVEIVQRYEAGESAPVLAAAYGVSHTTVGFHVKRRSTMRTASLAHTRHALRHDAFDQLDPEVEYWLGFLFADGCIEERPGNRQNALRLMLSARDVDHLEKFRGFLGAGSQVRRQATKKGYQAVVLVVHSDRLTGRLRAYGRYDGDIDQRLLDSVDFWRGVVDGDGSLGLYERTALKKYGYGPQPAISLAGSERLVSQFRDFVSMSLGLNRIQMYPHPGSVSVSWEWIQAQRIIDLLYRGAIVSLDRKQAIADQISVVSDGKKSGFSDFSRLTWLTNREER